MPLDSSRTTKIQDGQEKECLQIEFTNGALQQLEDLKSFIGTADPVDVVKTAISLLQRLKDAEGNKKQA